MGACTDLQDTLSRTESSVHNAARPSSYPFMKKYHGVQGCIPCGALAQLGERLICIQEVIGSIPIGSTSPAADASRGAS